MTEAGQSRLHRVPLATAFLLFVWPAAADTYPRQPGVDALHYAFRLTLSDDSNQISGEATLDVRFLSDGLTEFWVDLTGTSNGRGMTVSGVNLAGPEGTAVMHTHRSDRLQLSLNPPSKSGERRQFTIRYRGIPGSGLRIGSNKYNERTFFSLNWPDLARQYLPIIDHPSDKATSEFIVTAPARYQVVANGLLQEETDLGGGRRITHWRQSVPIASWLNAIGLAQFEVRQFGSPNGVPLQTWVYRRDRDAGIASFEDPVRGAFEFFVKNVGPYPYEKLANIEAAGLDGGVEHASAIFYGERSVTNRPATALVAHEVAHQWFGNSVTQKDWDDVWLSEGFATYFALLFTEHSSGRDAFIAGLKRSRNTVLEFEKKTPGVAVIHDNLADMRRVLNQLVYQKGGWTLHMLRGLIGEEKFWLGIRDYYRRYRDANASTDDFRKVMEENSGAGLEWFFQQWLSRPGSPEVQGDWRYNPAERQIEIELAQVQQSVAYRLPIEIGIHISGAVEPRVEKIEMTEKHQRFKIASDTEPASLVLDPNTWLLMSTRFETQRSKR